MRYRRVHSISTLCLTHLTPLGSAWSDPPGGSPPRPRGHCAIRNKVSGEGGNMYFVDAKYLYCDIQSRASHQLMQQPRDVQVWLHNIYKLSTPYLHIIYTISPQVWLHLHGGGRPPGLGLAGECEEAEDGETADQTQHRPQAEAGRSLEAEQDGASETEGRASVHPRKIQSMFQRRQRRRRHRVVAGRFSR